MHNFDAHDRRVGELVREIRSRSASPAALESCQQKVLKILETGPTKESVLINKLRSTRLDREDVTQTLYRLKSEYKIQVKEVDHKQHRGKRLNIWSLVEPISCDRRILDLFGDKELSTSIIVNRCRPIDKFIIVSTLERLKTEGKVVETIRKDGRTNKKVVSYWRLKNEY